MHTQVHSSRWQDVLKAPPRPTHILQICDSDEMLAAGAAYFAAEGLQRGEAVVLTGTQEHLAGIRRALRAHGVDAEAAERRGQLAAGDAHEAVRAVTVDGLPDRARFEAIAGEVLAKARADLRFAGVRWWGEMSNVFNQLGMKRDAVLLDEEIGDALCRRYEVSLFCSFQCDRLSPASYQAGLADLCARHTHAIPGDDYARERAAVNRALEEVLGPIDGHLLQLLVSWRPPATEMPSWQALLLWARDKLPRHFPAILARVASHCSRAHQHS